MFDDWHEPFSAITTAVAGPGDVNGVANKAFVFMSVLCKEIAILDYGYKKKHVRVIFLESS